MPRKVKTLTIAGPGRDGGKVFRITEMPAVRAERWAMRALVALARSGVDVPDDIADQGLQGLAVLGLRALSEVFFEDLSPLLDEMLTCVQIIPDPNLSDFGRALVDDDVEEVETILQLRREVFELHVDFSTVAAALKSRLAATGDKGGGSDTPTSPP
jgi:hypothetical protein